MLMMMVLFQDRMTMQYQDSGFSEEDADLQVTTSLYLLRFFLT